MFPIMWMAISNDSKNAITLTKTSDSCCWVKFYNLEDKKQIFQEKFGEHDYQYIKMKEVQQNANASMFAVPYFDDGKFYIRGFVIDDTALQRAKEQKTFVTRSKEEILSNELDINKLLGLNDWTMVIEGFMEPSMTCCFISHSAIFVSVFYNPKLEHHHFIYDLETKKVLQGPVKVDLGCLDSTKKNFPVSCFFNDEDDEIYTFYR